MKFIKNIFKSQKKLSGTFFLKLKDTLDISPKNKDLFEIAFTHSSLNKKDNQGNKINYERLEFLGDSIFSMIISQYIFFNFRIFRSGAPRFR